MNIINYDEYVSKIKKIFMNNQFTDILSTDLKKELELNDFGVLYGTVISMLISKKIIEKVDGKKIKINGKGKDVFYYKPGKNLLIEEAKENSNNKTFLIQDQFNNQYDYINDKLLDETLESLIKDNPKLQLTVYKEIKTVQAQLTIITKNKGE